MSEELDYSFIYTKYWLEDPAWSIRDIAKYYNVYFSKIYRFMERTGIERRDMKDSSINRYLCPWKKEQISEMWKENQKNPEFQKKRLLGYKKYNK